MFLLNLSLAEFLTLFTLAGSATVALYLLDRSRRSVRVSTLLFWVGARRPVESTRRRRIRQWGSLLLQLAALALLLLALSQLKWGNREDGSLDHVVILDQSAWMASAIAGNQTLMDQAKAEALAYVRALPSADRVMILTAAAISTPVTGFEQNHAKVEAAIRATQPTHSALDLQQAFAQARLLQRGARRPGEIAFAGSARASSQELTPPSNLRLLPLRANPPNVGLRRVGLRTLPGEPGLWRIHANVHNYGTQPQQVDIGIQFGGAPAGTHSIRLAPASGQEVNFTLRTRAAGLIEARIRSRSNALPLDDRAVLEIPALTPLPVTVCTADPNLWRPLVQGQSNVEARFLAPSACTPIEHGIAVYDRFVPPQTGRAHAIYVMPPGPSPIRVASHIAGASLEQWTSGHPVTSGLRAQGIPVGEAQILTPAIDDAIAGESAQGPILVTRRGPAKQAFFGFHPVAGSLRYELTIPLLFANILRWMEPETFRQWDIYAAGVGQVAVNVDPNLEQTAATVTTAAGKPLPFTLQNGTLRFFSGEPGQVRLDAAGARQVYSLTLPAVPETVWEAPGAVRRGVPSQTPVRAGSRDLWRALALFAAALLVIEWMRYAPAPALPSTAPQVEPAELRRAS